MRGVAQITAMVAMVAMVGCSKESAVDNAITEALGSRTIDFVAYSSTPSTKAPVIDNTTIKTNGFHVGAYLPNADQSAAQLYVPCTHVKCGSDGRTWGYVDVNGDPKKYYWPALESQQLSFVAHYPTGAESELLADDGQTTLFGNEQYAPADGDLAFSFGYTVHHDAESQFDLIYAIRENVACPSEAPYSVQLDFCHALTKVGFTAELDPALDVDIRVYDIVIHNICYTGTFVAKDETSGFNNNGVWLYASGGAETDTSGFSISEFGTSILGDGAGVELSTTEKKNLTDPDDALMLMPQYISAWVPHTSVGLDPTKVGAYLAISCEITQMVDGETITIHKKEKWLYAPLTTAITYPAGTLANDKSAATPCDWVAGYSVVYNLKFGGGYSTVPGTEEPVLTLTPMLISATAEAWTPVDGGELLTDE